MADEQLRELERAAAGGDTNAAAALLAGRLRAGDVARWALDFAIALDHLPALVLAKQEGFKHPAREFPASRSEWGRRVATNTPTDYIAYRWESGGPRTHRTGVITPEQQKHLYGMARSICSLPPSPVWRRYAAGRAAAELAFRVNEKVYTNPRHQVSLVDHRYLTEIVARSLAACVRWLHDSQTQISSGRLCPNSEPLLIWRTLNLCGDSSVSVSEHCMFEVLQLAVIYLDHRRVLEVLMSTVGEWALSFDERNLPARLPNSTRIKNVPLGRVTHLAIPIEEMSFRGSSDRETLRRWMLRHRPDLLDRLDNAVVVHDPSGDPRQIIIELREPTIGDLQRNRVSNTPQEEDE